MGKLCVTASWAIAICFTAELYPTVVRAKGMFTSTLCGNVGNSLAPMVGLLVSFDRRRAPLEGLVMHLALGLCSKRGPRNNKPI